MNRVSDPRGRGTILHESSQAHDRDGQNFSQPPTPSPSDAAGLAFTPLPRILGKKFCERRASSPTQPQRCRIAPPFTGHDLLSLRNAPPSEHILKPIIVHIDKDLKIFSVLSKSLRTATLGKIPQTTI